METGIVNRPSSMRMENMNAEDFETASIRSAAPSYTSEAPSYHSTVPETIPPYTPRVAAPVVVSSATDTSSSLVSVAEGSSHARSASLPETLPSASSSSTSASPPRMGLPPVPTGPLRRRSDPPSLIDFRIPTWSNVRSNPTARHYHSVASRRVNQASTSAVTIEGIKRMMLLDRIEEEERVKIRPLEDPHLVGEEAARRARAQRLARENGDDILMQENRRWDWFLAQMKDWEERERSWKQFRREFDAGSRPNLLRRLGAR